MKINKTYSNKIEINGSKKQGIKMSFILSSIKNTGTKLIKCAGFYTRKEIKIVIIGLSNAGKTTLLEVLLSDVLPKYTLINDTILPENIIFNIYNLDPDIIYKKTKKHYYIPFNCIIFVVDASDASNINKNVKELNKILLAFRDIEIPIAVIGNKIDVEKSYTKEEFKRCMYLHNEPDNVKVFMCSARTKSGIEDPLLWLFSKIE